MTDERITKLAQSVQSHASALPAVAPVPITRRMVLRGASAAIPTILTLQSGAALANASNGWTGGASSQGGSLQHTVTEEGPTQYACLATHNGQTEGPYQLQHLNGQPVTMIPADTEFQDPDASAGMEIVYGDDMCYRGGEFTYVGTGAEGQTVRVPQGMLMSAGAYSSLAAAGVIDPKSVFSTTL